MARIQRSIPAQGIAAFALAFAFGCGDGAASDPAPSVAVLHAPANPQNTLLRRSVNAASSIAHQGTRRVEAYWQVGAQTYTEVYRERVSSDGTGNFAVEPLDLLTQGATPYDTNLFFALHPARAGFVQRYRDFRIRSLGMFARNYVVQDLGLVVDVAGRPCAEFSIEREFNATLRYVADLDLETGLVLRSREEALDGTLLGLVEFESIDFDPDLSQVVWHQPTNDEEPLREDPILLDQQLGFDLKVPRAVTSDFELLEQSVVTDSSGPIPRKLAKFVYTDGVEVVLFLHGEGSLPSALLPRQAGVLDYVAVLDPSAKLGPWTVAAGWMRGLPFLAMGRVDAADLLDLAASANY